MEPMTPITVEEMYGYDLGQEDPKLEAQLVQSLNPRHSNMLYEKFSNFDVQPEDLILDVGCRDGKHTLRLAKTFGCRVIGFDPVPFNLDRANHHIKQATHGQFVSLFFGKSEAVPLRSQIFDHIWCRDVLSHTQLFLSLTNCFRLLTSGGKMLIYQTFATSLCEPKEAERMYGTFAIVPENMSPAFFEETAVSIGFKILEQDIIGSEWRENWVENGDDSLLKDLLAIARMRRMKESLINQFGEKRYEITRADCLWGIYQMLGKLQPTLYILQKP